MQKSSPVKESILFFGLTLGLSYLVFWGPLALFQIPAISFVSKTRGPLWAVLLFIAGGFVPSLVAVFLTWRREGAAGLKQLGRRALQFKIGWPSYLAIIGVVAFSSAGQILINRLLGSTFDFGLFLAQLGSLIPLLIVGPLSEEFGWRGYALDRLQARWNPVLSSLILGLMWGLWHAPLFAMVGTSQHELAVPYVGFVAGLMALSVVFTWLHNNTGGSIWTAVCFHWVYTYGSQVVASGITRSRLYNWLEYLPYVVLAGLVVVIWRPWHLPRMKPVSA